MVPTEKKMSCRRWTNRSRPGSSKGSCQHRLPLHPNGSGWPGLQREELHVPEKQLTAEFPTRQQAMPCTCWVTDKDIFLAANIAQGREVGALSARQQKAELLNPGTCWLDFVSVQIGEFLAEGRVPRSSCSSWRISQFTLHTWICKMSSGFHTRVLPLPFHKANTSQCGDSRELEQRRQICPQLEFPGLPRQPTELNKHGSCCQKL